MYVVNVVYKSYMLIFSLGKYVHMYVVNVVYKSYMLIFSLGKYVCMQSIHTYIYTELLFFFFLGTIFKFSFHMVLVPHLLHPLRSISLTASGFLTENISSINVTLLQTPYQETKTFKFLIIPFKFFFNSQLELKSGPHRLFKKKS